MRIDETPTENTKTYNFFYKCVTNIILFVSAIKSKWSLITKINSGPQLPFRNTEHQSTVNKDFIFGNLRCNSALLPDQSFIFQIQTLCFIQIHYCKPSVPKIIQSVSTSTTVQYMCHMTLRMKTRLKYSKPSTFCRNTKFNNFQATATVPDASYYCLRHASTVISMRHHVTRNNA